MERQLRQIIKEERAKLINEASARPSNLSVAQDMADTIYSEGPNGPWSEKGLKRKKSSRWKHGYWLYFAITVKEGKLPLGRLNPNVEYVMRKMDEYANSVFDSPGRDYDIVQGYSSAANAVDQRRLKWHAAGPDVRTWQS